MPSGCPSQHLSPLTRNTGLSLKDYLTFSRLSLWSNTPSAALTGFTPKSHKVEWSRLKPSEITWAASILTHVSSVLKTPIFRQFWLPLCKLTVTAPPTPSLSLHHLAPKSQDRSMATYWQLGWSLVKPFPTSIGRCKFGLLRSMLLYIWGISVGLSIKFWELLENHWFFCMQSIIQ